MGINKGKSVGIGEMVVSNSSDDVIVAHGLGSCLGITAYDPINKVGGVIHCLLPLSRENPEKAESQPCLFVDTGVVIFLNKLIEMGAEKKNLIIKVAGGAQSFDAAGVFNIGNRNFTAFRKIMWKNKLLIKGQDVGGTSSRTIKLHMSDGRVAINSHQEVHSEL